MQQLLLAASLRWWGAGLLFRYITEATADIRVQTKDLSGGIKHYNNYPGPVGPISWR